jgi:hypothetical protein
MFLFTNRKFTSFYLYKREKGGACYKNNKKISVVRRKSLYLHAGIIRWNIINAVAFAYKWSTVCNSTLHRFFDEYEQKDSKIFGGLERKGVYL